MLKEAKLDIAFVKNGDIIGQHRACKLMVLVPPQEPKVGGLSANCL